MNRFYQMIFLGNGDASMANCYQLHRMLEEALMILGGCNKMFSMLTKLKEN